jgi:EmrB/QacA subfamily drug resistance transporter
MVVLDISVVNVALPDMARDLHLGGADLPWVIAAYSVCFGGLLLLGGRLADSLGRRRMFVTGLVTFTAASLLAGLATGAATILTARAAQGVGAALLSPAALSILTTTFSGPARNRALAVWGAVGGSGAAVGVLIGGLLTSGPGWQWVFFINIPVGLLVAALTPRFVPHGQADRSGGRVDVPGGLLVTAATGALIYGLVSIGDATSTGVGALIGSAVVYALFVLVERRAAVPLVHMLMLAQRTIAAGVVVMLAASALLVSGFFLLSLVLQRVMGMSALQTGLVFLPVAVAAAVGAHFAGSHIGRTGPRGLAVGSFLVAGLGLGMLTRVDADARVWTAVLPWFVLAAAGLGAGFVTATTTAMARVDARHAGVVSGTVNTAHELGAAIGVAVMSTIAGVSISAGGSPSVAGFGTAFGVAAIAAAGLAVASAWLVPRGRLPESDGPRFVH